MNSHAIKPITEKNYTDKLKYLDILGIDYKNIKDIDAFVEELKHIKLQRSKNKNSDNCFQHISIATVKLYIAAVCYYYGQLDNPTKNTEIINNLTSYSKTKLNETQNKIGKFELKGAQIINYITWDVVLILTKKLDYRGIKILNNLGVF